MPFLSDLRSLDAKATPGLWEWIANEDGYPAELVGVGVGVLRPGIAVSPTDGRLSAHITNDDGGAGPEHPDFALLVLLRNHAARIAAVVEAAGAIVEDLGDGTHVVRREHIVALRAALAALEAP
jgi:hypothetical protein